MKLIFIKLIISSDAISLTIYQRMCFINHSKATNISDRMPQKRTKHNILDKYRMNRMTAMPAIGVIRCDSVLNSKSKRNSYRI